MESYLQIVGIAGAPLIRETIKATKITNGVVCVLLSLIFGVLLNMALAIAIDNDVRIAIALGIVTGFVSNVYNDIKSV